MMGATRGFGNTEEDLVRTNYGLEAHDSDSDTPFDHATGMGRVAAKRGLYHDCIHVKRNTLLLLISEVYGGINGRGQRFLTRLAHTAGSASDAVYYDRAGRMVSFYVHHSRKISCAAAVGHARVIQRLCADVRSRVVRMRAAAATTPATITPLSSATAAAAIAAGTPTTTATFACAAPVVSALSPRVL